jgi:HK97 family phage major capsid protein
MTTTGPVSLAPRALALGRYIECLVKGAGDPLAMHAFAQGQGPSWSSTPSVLLQTKAAVDALDSGDLVQGPIANEVAELLRPHTIIGRVAGFRRVPFGLRLFRQTGGMSAGWVREGFPIPAGSADYTQGLTLQPAKLGVIVALSDELRRVSTTSAQALAGTELSNAIAQAKDTFFVDPAWSGTADTPASVTYGAAQLSSRGATVAAIDADLRDMIRVLTDAGCSLATAAWLMHSSTAASMSLMRGADGALAYPGVTARGGTLAGLPVVTSPACAASGSPGEKFITLLEASEVMLANEGQSDISIAKHTSVQLDDAPGSGAQPLVSLWQANLIGIRARLYVNWARRHDGAVVVLRDVAY